MGKCPHEFTGNADDVWHDFFAAAWQFGKYASTQDLSGSGPSIEMSIHGFPEAGYNVADAAAGKYPGFDYKAGTIPIDSEPGVWCADGITLKLTENGGWAADVVMHFMELLMALPGYMPDGELEIHFPCDPTPKDVNGGRDSRVVLHLWHD
jgi:hypothetical protein